MLLDQPAPTSFSVHMKKTWNGMSYGFLCTLVSIPLVCWFFLLLFSANVADLWGDEIGVLWVVKHPLFGLNILKAIKSQIAAPPGDYLTLTIYERLFHGPALAIGMPDEVFFRIPYAFISALGGFLFFDLFLRSRVYKLAAVAGALYFYLANDPMWYYAIEIRFYAWLMFFTIFTYWMFVRCLEKYNALSPKVDLWTYGWLASVFTGTMFHAFVLFPGLGQAAALFLSGNKRQKWQIALGTGFTVLTVKLMAMFAMNVGRNPHMEQFTNPENYYAFLSSLAYWTTPLKGHEQAILSACVLVLVLGLIKKETRVISISVLIPAILCVFIPAITRAHGRPFAERYVILLVPICGLILVYGVDFSLKAGAFFAKKFVPTFKTPHFVSLAAVSLLVLYLSCLTASNWYAPKRVERTWRIMRTMLNGKTPDVIYGLDVPVDVSITPQINAKGQASWIGFTWQYYLLGMENMTEMPYSEETKMSTLKEAKLCDQYGNPADRKKISVSFCDVGRVNGVPVPL